MSEPELPTPAAAAAAPVGDAVMIPLPPAGAVEAVPETGATRFAWDYRLHDPALVELYEKGKKLQWNATTDIDWSLDVDPERFPEFMKPENFSAMFDTPRKLSVDEVTKLRVHQFGWMLSQFLHGEQGALLATARIVSTVPHADAKFYASTQVIDEARHVEAYQRYLTEKLGFAYPVNPHLHTLLTDIVHDSRWDMTYLGMQIMIEGLALAAFGLVHLMNPHEKLIQQITRMVMRDEARHVAFGVLALEKVYADMSEAELREREDFVIEAARLMRDRLLMEEVWDELGWPRDEWVEWTMQTPFMRGFRQMLFSKIVPNLKRLGLLTPRVRTHFEQLGVLGFENEPDSTAEASMAPPPALLSFFARVMRAGRT